MKVATAIRSLERILATISFGLNPPARYLMAVLLVGVALAVRWMIAPPSAGIPFLTFFPAAALSAIIGGLGPGLLAAGLGAALAYWLFTPYVDASAVLSILIFLADGIIVCSAIEAMRRYYIRSVATMRTLEQSVERLTVVNAELGRFAYIASHDLQEPLRSITSFSQLIQRDYGDRLDNKGQEYLGFVVDGGKRMHGLINDLLAYSRITTEAKLRGEVDSGDAARTALDNLMAEIRESGATVDVGSLPAVKANNVQLVQVFQNLLGNAIKFRAPDRSLRVSVTAQCDERECVFTVTDNGIGFDAAGQDVFEIFRQLHPRGRYPGQGVGLAICRRIIQEHEGRIWADSLPGRGSAIYFSLPVGDAAALPA